jgi:UDP-galactopyranose mutase
VSTSIRDVVRPYGDLGLARIADTVDEAVAAIESSLAELGEIRQSAADAFMSEMSWDSTWANMWRLVEDVLRLNRRMAATEPQSQETAPETPNAPAVAMTA